MTTLPGMGGSAISTAAIARGLATLDWEIHVLTTTEAYAAGATTTVKPATSLVRSSQDAHGTTWHTPADSAGHDVLPDNILHWVRYSAALESLVDELKPKVLNPHYVTAYTRACIEAARGTCPVIASMHGTDASEPPPELVKHTATSLQACAATTAVSLWLANLAKDTYDIPTPEVIYNWLPDLPQPLTTSEKKRNRSAHRLPHYDYLVVHASNLRPIKQAHLCIYALGELRKAGINAGLAIAGDGPEREHLLERASNLQLTPHVHALGAMQNSTALIAAADAVWLPSRSEGLSRVAIEAGAAGVPVASIAGTGINEVVIPEITGILAEEPTPESFAEAAMRLQSSSHIVELSAVEGPSAISKFRNLNDTVGAYARLFAAVQ